MRMAARAGGDQPASWRMVLARCGGNAWERGGLREGAGQGPEGRG